MANQDYPEHHRLRTLVNKAFTPEAISKIKHRMESLTQEKLDEMVGKDSVDLIQSYAHPLPIAVMTEIMGADQEEMSDFVEKISATLSRGSGLGLIRAMLWDLPQVASATRQIIKKKRNNPADDILSALIEAREEDDRLSEDELVSLIFLVIAAGVETTVHVVGNAVVTLLQHPEQFAQLRENPSLMSSAVEECLRFAGPALTTDFLWAKEEVTLHGVTIPRGSAVMAFLGAANFDPTEFNSPERFDIHRSPNRHIGFGFGRHFCLGAALARMEIRIALTNLLERAPALRLAVPPSELRFRRTPGVLAYEAVPVSLRPR